jgi:hypothetical protein
VTIAPVIVPASTVMPRSNDVWTADLGTDHSPCYSPNRSQYDGPNPCADPGTFQCPCFGRDRRDRQRQHNDSSREYRVHAHDGPLF